ncbi:MAG: GNAT family N-acetyltransferase [Pseudomonadota bacterium]
MPTDPVIPPGKLRVTITHLEMWEAPSAPMPAAPTGTRVERITAPTVPFYRYLYNTVGEDWLWGDRRRMSDAALATHLADPAIAISVLYRGGAPAGFYELDCHLDGEVELAYFGLLPHATGQGLGPFLLGCALVDAWKRRPDRVWVHTCSLDHPAALSVYRRAGFADFKTETVLDDDPRVLGLIRRSAAPQHAIVE